MAETSAWKHIKKNECPHIAELKEDITSDKDSCEARLPASQRGEPDGQACGYTDDLRICMTCLPDGQACGSIFCCESHSAHNTEHFKETGHPFIAPQKSDYNWLWCYKCNAFLK